MVKLPDHMPIPIANLPINKAGYPVPFFVARLYETKTDDYDFRIMRHDGIQRAWAEHLCWICGELRSGIDAFVAGPMCAVNRTSAEPPSHLTCARWAAIACPFLATPKMVRRDRGKEDYVPAAGVALQRNPGVAMVWKVREDDWEPYRVPAGIPGARPGILFDMGTPRGVEWYAEGRVATREEVLESMRTGLPNLLEVAEDEGPEAAAELARMYEDALGLVPA